MNLWNKLTSLFSKTETATTVEEVKTTVATATTSETKETTETSTVTPTTTPTETSTVKCSCSDVFVQLCTEAGVSRKELNKVNAATLFDEWYDGVCDEESVLNAIPALKNAYPSINAKLTGKL